ncbi:non-homologous end-joining DNA ligase [Horticoccus luteus]|uniref:Non-homologous end-joining DNA ligase n=1 Tax=Horticoccus luteus TaxID=2862869 RepID=A0A8F9TSA7_9BACT|nr:non-homologous end-joining DNA ligase [Horticoccus luteus]QYM78106.1 non-homologous end-joining DNA ligase [Horticoccus luteus]
MPPRSSTSSRSSATRRKRSSAQSGNSRQRAAAPKSSAAAQPRAGTRSRSTRAPANAAAVPFTNLDKVLFPASGTTKGDVIKYYLDVAPVLIPHFRARPVTLIRFPDGVTGEKFYEKNAPRFAPAWIKTAPVPRSDGGAINYIVINDARTLAWCANLAALELHPFLHHARAVQRPTHLVFDLDPGEGADLLTCIEVAFHVREALGQLQFKVFPKVSGSKGLQLYVPLNTPVTYATAKPFAKALAELLRTQHPDLIVSDMSKALRRKKVLIDWSQNDEKKTTAGVYSLRAKRDEPFVSLPVTWDELRRAAKKDSADALFFSPADALKRIARQGDLFAPVLTLKQRLPRDFTTAARSAPAASSRPKSAGRAPDSASTGLARYRAKRDFTRTAEPSGKTPSRSRARGAQQLRFVIQKHAASRLHYDFRLELDGTLKSWAVPKGLPYEPGIKRAAFEVEDHPLDYIDFEGTIPPGQYGGGTVMVWDTGTYELLSGDHRRGDLKLMLHGQKLKGEWHIFRIKSEDDKPVWLIVKAKPAMKPLSARRENQSVLTQRTMEKIASDNDAVWESH